MSESVNGSSTDFLRVPQDMLESAMAELRAIENSALTIQHGKRSEHPTPAVSTVIGSLALLPLARAWKVNEIQGRHQPDALLVDAMRTGLRFRSPMGGMGQYLRATDPERQPEQVGAFLLEFRKCLGHVAVQTSSAMALAGAVGEMHDNIWQHSGMPSTGFCGYEVRSDFIAFGVSDSGWGLSRAYAQARGERTPVGSSSALMENAVLHGESRILGTGRGTGFSTLLRVLRKFDASVRVRSDDVVLDLCPTSDGKYAATLKSQAHLTGFVVCAQIKLSSARP
jgi:anti-sigma regulatory factor (Ser/Thr protein kinase)